MCPDEEEGRGAQLSVQAKWPESISVPKPLGTRPTALPRPKTELVFSALGFDLKIFGFYLRSLVFLCEH